MTYEDDNVVSLENLVPQYRQIQQIACRLRLIGDQLDADQRITRYKEHFHVHINMNSSFSKDSFKANYFLGKFE